jgi:hypothetical protein
MIQCGPPFGNWRSSIYKGAAVSGREGGGGVVSGQPIVQKSGNRCEGMHSD